MQLNIVVSRVSELWLVGPHFQLAYNRPPLHEGGCKKMFPIKQIARCGNTSRVSTEEICAQALLTDWFHIPGAGKRPGYTT